MFGGRRSWKPKGTIIENEELTCVPERSRSLVEKEYSHARKACGPKKCTSVVEPVRNDEIAKPTIWKQKSWHPKRIIQVEEVHPHDEPTKHVDHILAALENVPSAIPLVTETDSVDESVYEIVRPKMWRSTSWRPKAIIAVKERSPKTANQKTKPNKEKQSSQIDPFKTTPSNRQSKIEDLGTKLGESLLNVSETKNKIKEATDRANSLEISLNKSLKMLEAERQKAWTMEEKTKELQALVDALTASGEEPKVEHAGLPENVAAPQLDCVQAKEEGEVPETGDLVDHVPAVALVEGLKADSSTNDNDSFAYDMGHDELFSTKAPQSLGSSVTPELEETEHSKEDSLEDSLSPSPSLRAVWCYSCGGGVVVEEIVEVWSAVQMEIHDMKASCPAKTLKKIKSLTDKDLMNKYHKASQKQLDYWSEQCNASFSTTQKTKQKKAELLWELRMSNHR